MYDFINSQHEENTHIIYKRLIISKFSIDLYVQSDLSK